MSELKLEGIPTMDKHNTFVRFVVDMQAKASSKGADGGLNKLGWALVILAVGWAVARVIEAVAVLVK